MSGLQVEPERDATQPTWDQSETLAAIRSEIEGLAAAAKQAASATATTARDTAMDSVHTLEDTVRRHPLPAIAIAGAVGLGVMLLLRPRSSPTRAARASQALRDRTGFDVRDVARSVESAVHRAVQQPYVTRARETVEGTFAGFDPLKDMATVADGALKWWNSTRK